jgi:hypothetical protein
MRRIRGIYTFYLHTFKKPVKFSIRPDKDTLLEIQSSGRFLEFALTSDTQQDDVFWSWISISADGLGFMLDFPIYSSYSTAFEEVTQLPPDSTIDAQIDFDLVVHTMKYDQTVGHYVDAEIPKNVDFSTSEIRNFITKLRSSLLLNTAVGYYLKSIEEPEFLLVSLYKAHELIRNTGVVSNTAANKFTRLANDTGVYGSRHTSKQALGVRSLSPDERKYCQELIRNGIFRLARSL